jgi:methionyl-tRNA formyltransferase
MPGRGRAIEARPDMPRGARSGAQARVVLFAMTAKGRAVLEAVLGSRKEMVRAVVGARDAAMKEDAYEDIRGLATARGVPHFDRREFDEATLDQEGLVGIAISWRWLIGASNLVVLHDSLLPKYRGFNPLVSALLNGEKKIGVTATLAGPQFDRGGILAQKSLDVTYPVKIAAAIERVSGCYVAIVEELLAALERGALPPAKEQNEAEASYSLWRDEADYRIDWSQPAASIARKVDSVGHPYAGASTLAGGKLYRVLDAEVRPDVRIENRAPGKVLEIDRGCPVVVCGSGLLMIADLRDESGASALPLARVRTRFE